MKKLLAAFAIVGMMVASPAFAQAPALQTAPAQTAPDQSAPASNLPNGASSLSETFSDWMVGCESRTTGNICSMTQQRPADNQTMVAIKLDLSKEGNLSGFVVLPFGVLATKPITFQIDDTRTVITSNIRTCMPFGCVVPIAFDKTMISALRAGKTIKIGAQNSTPGEEPIPGFSISLTGFGAAYDRITALMK